MDQVQYFLGESRNTAIASKSLTSADKTLWPVVGGTGFPRTSGRVSEPHSQGSDWSPTEVQGTDELRQELWQDDQRGGCGDPLGRQRWVLTSDTTVEMEGSVGEGC